MAVIMGTFAEQMDDLLTRFALAGSVTLDRDDLDDLRSSATADYDAIELRCVIEDLEDDKHELEKQVVYLRSRIAAVEKALQK